jgi:hypothetical protein
MGAYSCTLRYGYLQKILCLSYRSYPKLQVAGKLFATTKAVRIKSKVCMKKIIILAVALFIFCSNVYPQTAGEWLNQKSTQKKYLLQQIAALQVYIGYARKGYNIVSKRINTVHNIKKGDFNLHRDFFSSLKNVNPRINNYVKVADIITFQLRIIKQIKQTLQGIRETKQFTPEELDYCKLVFDSLLDECVKSIDELIMVTTSGNLQMKEDERLKRIDNIYADMQDKYSFCSSFSDEMGLLSVQRMGEQIEINRSKILNGVR